MMVRTIRPRPGSTPTLRTVRRAAGVWCAVIALLSGSGTPAHACVGTACLQVYSTAELGGALTVLWDFASEKVQTFKTRLCAPDDCLYSAIDPGFIAGFDPSSDSARRPCAGGRRSVRGRRSGGAPRNWPIRPLSEGASRC